MRGRQLGLGAPRLLGDARFRLPEHLVRAAGGFEPEGLVELPELGLGDSARGLEGDG